MRIKVNLKDALANLRRRGNAMPQVMRKALFVWSEHTLRRFASKAFSGPPWLQVRTGGMRRSFQHITNGDTLSSLRTLLYSDHIAAGVHEFGGPNKARGPIVPRNAKYLAIPMPGGPALSSAGHKLYGSPLRDSLPADMKIRPITTRSGRHFLVDKYYSHTKGAEKLSHIWFELKKSVRIEPRLGFRQSCRTNIGQINSLWKEHFNARFNRGG